MPRDRRPRFDMIPLVRNGMQPVEEVEANEPLFIYMEAYNHVIYDHVMELRGQSRLTLN